MAEYFLAKCPSYQKEVGSQQYKRRAVVCKHLNSDYKAGRDKEDATFSIAQTELQEEGIDISRYQYQHDKVVLRNAFLYLNCPDDESRNEFFAKLTMTKSAILGIRYLRTDGI